MTQQNDKFNSWFLRSAWRFVGPTVVAAVTGYGLSYVNGINVENAFGRFSLAQFLFLTICLILFAYVRGPSFHKDGESTSHNDQANQNAYEKLGYSKEDWKDAKRRARDSLSQFRKAWLATLASWALLYLVFYLHARLALTPDKTGWAAFTTIADFVNVCSHASLLACYIVLSEKTIDTDTAPFVWLLPIFGIGVLEVLLVIAFSLDPQLTSGLKLIIIIFGAILGIVGGMVLGLLVGQLDSYHLDSPVWLLAILFGYAAIQPLYPILHGLLGADDLGKSANSLDALAQIRDISPSILICVAGVCKLLICLFIYHSFRSGRLLFYFTRMRTIADSVDNEWSIFKKTLDKLSNSEIQEKGD